MTYKKLTIAGLRFSVSSVLDLDFGPCSKVFYSEYNEPADVEYEIIGEKCAVSGEKLFHGEVYSIYEDDKYIYRSFNENVGGFVLVREKSNPDKAWLYGDADELKRQEQGLLRGYLALEVPFIHRHTYNLHSSIIKINDCAVVFSGPSKIGKSTQASLWQNNRNADILNGDRSCIKLFDNRAEGYGSFYAGSSNIYRNESAPIKAFVVLGQSDENELHRLSPSEAFRALYSQTLNNPWDEKFVSMLVSDIEKTISLVPVYKLNCRPDSSAVDILYNELFG